MLNRSILSAFIVVAGLPLSVSAQILFTEVMYDLPGADTGREWVEIQNTGTVPIDLSGWKLFENGSNHRMTSVVSAVIPSGGYAVIVANTERFLDDWPQFPGTIFKSSFSLSNAGESLSLKNVSGEEVVALTYGASAAGGDGNTLNRVGDAWSVRKPTPGSLPSSERLAPPQKSSGNSSARAAVSLHESTDAAKAASNAAAAALSDEGESTNVSSLIPWLVALVAVIAIGIGAVMMVRKKPVGSGYTIIEEKT